MAAQEHVLALKAILTSLPLSEEQLLQVEEHVKACSLTELASMGLAPPPRPIMPSAKALVKLAPAARLQCIQRTISGLQYNHMPGYLYNVSKDRPYSSIMNTAKEVLRDALPIKCIEAVFLGMLLTSSWTELERLPVGFKSKCQGNTYRHIVLAVHHTPTGKWGALGISRRPELHFKELTATSLADLMGDYKTSYEQWGHTLHKIRVGLPVEHEPEAAGQVCWRYCCLSCGRHPWTRCATILNAFADNARRLAHQFRLLGVKPPSRRGSEGAGRSQGRRIPLCGTTPEPGATRTAAAATTQAATPGSRRHSLSPRRQPLVKTTTLDSARAAAIPPIPPPRKGSISAPPRPRPKRAGQVATHKTTPSLCTSSAHQPQASAQTEHHPSDTQCQKEDTTAGNRRHAVDKGLNKSQHDASILGQFGQMHCKQQPEGVVTMGVQHVHVTCDPPNDNPGVDAGSLPSQDTSKKEPHSGSVTDEELEGDLSDESDSGADENDT